MIRLMTEAVTVLVGFSSLSCTVPKTVNPSAQTGGNDTAVVVHGQPPAPAPASVIDLRDGSRIIGTPLLSTVPLLTSYGSAVIKPAEITSMVAADSSTELKVVFKNGDVLRGTLQVDSLPVQSVVGKVNIPVSSIRRMTPVSMKTDTAGGPTAYPGD